MRWTKLFPAVAVAAALVFSGMRMENTATEKNEVKHPKIMSAEELEGFFSYEESAEDDNTGKTGPKAAAVKTSAASKSGKIITASSKRSLPASTSGAGGNTGGGMGSTYTPVVQIPAFGYKDGTYHGTGAGFGGAITVSVTVSESQIVSISVLSASGETASYFSSAQAVIDRVLASQSPNVDAVSGATYSSNGIIQAIQDALSQAGMDSDDQAVTPTPKPSQKAEPTQESSYGQGEINGYKNGTYQGKGTGFGGDIILTVKIKKGIIKKISVTHHDTESFFNKAWEEIKPAILEKQSVQGIDTVSGATYSSSGILEAMKDVIWQAGYQAGDAPGEATPEPGEATPEPGEATPEPGEATPESGETMPESGELTPVPGELMPEPGGLTPAPELTPVPGETMPTPGLTPTPELTPMPGEPTPTPGELPPAPGLTPQPGEIKPTTEATPTPVPEGPYIDGTYSGTAWGYMGKVNITVTISGGQIVSIEQSNKDTEEFFNTAWDSILPQVMAKQNADGIDTVSGATFSSEGIIGGIRNALSQAKG